MPSSGVHGTNSKFERFLTDKCMVGVDVRGGGEKELGLKNTLVSNMSRSKMIVHNCHGLKKNTGGVWARKKG
jgi:hypothetical protein